MFAEVMTSSDPRTEWSGANWSLVLSRDGRHLLPSILEVLARQAKSLDVALPIDIQKELYPISLDAEKIAWTVTALVGNALRYVRHGSYTRPGGTVTVRATCSTDAREVTIEIQDDGPGIPPDALRTLSATRHTGTPIGLGLSMVREVVVAHGGTMAILSDTDALQPARRSASGCRSCHSRLPAPRQAPPERGRCDQRRDDDHQDES